MNNSPENWPTREREKNKITVQSQPATSRKKSHWSAPTNPIINICPTVTPRKSLGWWVVNAWLEVIPEERRGGMRLRWGGRVGRGALEAGVVHVSALIYTVLTLFMTMDTGGKLCIYIHTWSQTLEVLTLDVLWCTIFNLVHDCEHFWEAMDIHTSLQMLEVFTQVVLCHFPFSLWQNKWWD